MQRQTCIVGQSAVSYKCYDTDPSAQPFLLL